MDKEEVMAEVEVLDVVVVVLQKAKILIMKGQLPTQEDVEIKLLKGGGRRYDKSNI